MAILGSCTSPDVAAASSEAKALTLLLPLGSTEQHGPHLPLDTDTRIAQAVAAGVAHRLESVRVAPAISITASDEHRGFAGTLSVGTRVLSEMLIEIVGNAGPEFGRIVAINGHGGNAYALRAATEVCKARGRAFEVWSVRLPGADAHAGRTETSLMLAIAEDLVQLDQAEARGHRTTRRTAPQDIRGWCSRGIGQWCSRRSQRRQCSRGNQAPCRFDRRRRQPVNERLANNLHRICG